MSAFPLKANPILLSVNISKGGIPKLPHDSIMARTAGLEGDGRNHTKHIRPDRAVSLWDYELLQAFAAEGYALTPGAAGENLTVQNVNVQRLPPGTLLRIGDVVLKLEQIRKPCYVLDAIDPQLKDVVVGRIGYMASVVSEGILEPGMPIEVIAETRPAELAASGIDAVSIPNPEPGAPSGSLNPLPLG